LSLHIIDVNL